ncbi:PREDICTED: zinc finger and BTB domain-containing protein 21 isoform X2 [Nanorana parkeri]|uniref:zinc finger and BTB domain-containing protein 21 isoform X2 n=1 Tax=Nanorana parkeri TaxID=125878 RepID=UPI000854EA7E|nr:PREDICTED: zinc finger and BTB domain-containing protein 21 isoform X2 [Nanorana parkeri]
MDGLLHYINPAHAISILSSLNEERLKGQLCDVLLIVGDQKFRAHKNVLAASSEYFHSLFTDKNNESQAVFQLDFCEADAFENVLNYIYSSSLFVEKGSLAAVQELGYSLGISFLTNILSKTPQAPFSSPSKKSSLHEEDESGSQQRSVIVCQSRNEVQSRDSCSQDKSQTKPSTSLGKASSVKHHMRPGDSLAGFLSSERKWHGLSNSGEPPLSGSLKRKATFHQKVSEGHDDYHNDHPSAGSYPRGNEILKRKLASASLLGSTEPLYSSQKPEKDALEMKDERNVLSYPQLGLVAPSARFSGPQIDRSGPLVKSLLRRSLSMDSQVPVYSQSIDLQSVQVSLSPRDNPNEDVPTGISQRHSLKGTLDKPGIRDKDQEKTMDPLRPFSSSQSTSTENDVCIKTEPSSPASEPSEVMRITVGDAAQKRSRAFPVKSERPPHSAKRKNPPEKRMPPLRVRLKRSSSPESDGNFAALGDFSDSDDSKEMFASFLEQGNHERMCRNATLCPYCSLRFSTPEQKNEHEPKCEYKKLTCLECMRTFKSSFSIWRHQVEVHNQNTMTPTENFSLPVLDHNGEVGIPPRLPSLSESGKGDSFLASKDDGVYSDSSEHMNFDSEDSNCLPEDLSVSKQFNVKIKEEPADEMDDSSEAVYGQQEDVAGSERGRWSCEKCGKTFTVHKQLERHQELLCSVKPFICHVCNKAFRTNFRLWSHFQSHMAQGEDSSSFKEPEACAPVSSPSPPPPPPPPPPPKIPPIEPERRPSFPEKSGANEKGFAPQESDTLFYHAPPLSAITFKRQFMCKLCHRTFKTAFSLWSHEQTHN